MADLGVKWPRGRSERKSVGAFRYESCLCIWRETVFHAHTYTHTHLTSAWNVVGPGAPKRMENGVREGKRREKGSGGSVEGLWLGGGSRDRERSDGHRVYSLRDDHRRSGVSPVRALLTYPESKHTSLIAHIFRSRAQAGQEPSRHALPMTPSRTSVFILATFHLSWCVPSTSVSSPLDCVSF